MRLSSMLAVGLMALALPACPNEVPDSSQFVAGDAGADGNSGADGAPSGDAAPTSDAPGDSGSADADSADAPSADSDAQDAAGDAGCPPSGCDPGKVCSEGVCLPAPLKATRIVAGGSTTCVLLSDSTAACWGDGEVGQLADGKSGVGHFSAIPAVIPGLINVTDIACGSTHCCAVSDGTVKCWGGNQYGGSSPGAASAVLQQPVAVPGVKGATAVAAASYHSCALVAAGAVKCWGLGTAGQLGDGNGGNPGAVVSAKIGGSSAVQIRAGANHTCIRTALGTGLCWGYNGNG